MFYNYLNNYIIITFSYYKICKYQMKQNYKYLSVLNAFKNYDASILSIMIILFI